MKMRDLKILQTISLYKDTTYLIVLQKIFISLNCPFKL
jgi:hypothetical protein